MSHGGAAAGGTEREAQSESLAAAPVPESEQRPADREPRQEPLPREYHAEPREPPVPHEPAPIAHFEPSPKPDPGKPYVVWSSAPPDKSSVGPDPEE
jgi:hypothetical protein